MSRKRKNKLYRGKFYTSYPNGGHPALIFRKNKRKNRYDAIVFGTSSGHHRIKLKHPISITIKESVIHNRPTRGTRKDFGDKELTNLRIHKDDRIIIKIVKKRSPQETKRFREHIESRKNKKSR